MSLIDRAEQLKKELTDKWVVVSSTAPELKRFAALTGRVKTVNMNCRALVEFDNGIDISWYDIEPGYLTVVDAPRPKKAAAHAADSAAPKAAAKPAAAAAAPAAAGSPLDKIRAAAGAKPAAAPPAAGSPLDKIRAAAAKPAAAPATGGSPLDKIRAAAAKPATTAPEAAPAPAPAAAPA
ncbi:MAG: hypothetical protein RLZZ436_1778, partial [Planctomycetota bacterium]